MRRIINFGYDPKIHGVIYFTTFPGNQKTRDIEANNKVTFLPATDGLAVEGQVRVKGIAKQSSRTIEEIAPLILEKEADFQELLNEASAVLLVYEIQFEKAEVTIGMEEPQLISVV